MGGGQRKQIWKLPIILTQSSLHTKHPILWSQICGLIPYIHLGLPMGVYHSGLASFCRWRSHLKPPFPDDVPAVSHMPNLSIFSHMVPYSPIWSHILPYDFIFSHRFPYISIFSEKKNMVSGTRNIRDFQFCSQALFRWHVNCPSNVKIINPVVCLAGGNSVGPKKSKQFFIPSGYVKIAIENVPFIVDLPFQNGDFQ